MNASVGIHGRVIVISSLGLLICFGGPFLVAARSDGLESLLAFHANVCVRQILCDGGSYFKFPKRTESRVHFRPALRCKVLKIMKNILDLKV